MRQRHFTSSSAGDKNRIHNNITRHIHGVLEISLDLQWNLKLWYTKREVRRMFTRNFISHSSNCRLAIRELKLSFRERKIIKDRLNEEYGYGCRWKLCQFQNETAFFATYVSIFQNFNFLHIRISHLPHLPQYLLKNVFAVFFSA